MGTRKKHQYSLVRCTYCNQVPPMVDSSLCYKCRTKIWRGIRSRKALMSGDVRASSGQVGQKLKIETKGGYPDK